MPRCVEREVKIDGSRIAPQAQELETLDSPPRGGGNLPFVQRVTRRRPEGESMRLSKFAPLVLLLPTSVASAPSSDPCPGCIGAGGGGGAAGGGGTVVISVTMEPGKCKLVTTYDPPQTTCRQTKACQATISRSWSGLPPNTEMEFCINFHDLDYCLEPPPSTTDDGEGSSTIGPIPIACGDGATWSIGSGSLVAIAQGNCSECPE